MDQIDEIVQAIRDSRWVVALTGAGVSAESGIPTFRAAAEAARQESGGPGGPATMAGLWQEFDPATLATPQAFAADPERVSRWYDWRRLGCLAAEPNPGHLALAELERLLQARGDGARLTVLTQNVDRLHQKAGSREVVELHGNIITWRCTVTGRQVAPGPEPMGEFPPRSPHDGRGVLRPNVVWFGEMLPEEAVEAAQRAAAGCDVFMSIGTSSVVHPAARFIRAAAARGARTVEINPEPTPITGLVDWSVRGKSGEVLPRIVEGLHR